MSIAKPPAHAAATMAHAVTTILTVIIASKERRHQKLEGRNMAKRGRL